MILGMYKLFEWKDGGLAVSFWGWLAFFFLVIGLAYMMVTIGDNWRTKVIKHTETTYDTKDCEDCK